MLIHLEKLGKSFGEKVVLHDVTASVEREDRIGIVGQNGAGKTTLLKILTGEYQDYDGEFSVTHGVTLGYLEQNAKLDPTLDIYGEMRATFAPVLDAMAQMQVLERKMAAQPDNTDLLAQHDALQNIVDAADGYNMDVNIKKVLSGMGFAQDTWEKNIAVLSGGELTRLRLAKLLLEKPDVLILDEPTNHLDFATMEWLENYLKGYSGAVLVVSHDRYFLDAAATGIIDLENHHIRSFRGGYSRYLETKTNQDKAYQKAYDKQQEHIKETEEYIRRYKAGIKAKQARGRQSQLNRLERLDKPVHQATLRFHFDPPQECAEKVLDIVRAKASYKDHLIFEDLNLHIKKGEVLGLIGPNGAGKTTLLKLITGEKTADSGIIQLGNNVKMGYYSQEQERLHPELSVLDEVRDTFNFGEKEARNILGMFLFRGDDVFKQVAMLSGGEKARLSLLCLFLEKPNFLILDEPTNHLDIPTREIMEQAIQAFGGTSLVVSHDRYFLDKITTRIVEMEHGKLTEYLGNYSYYKEKKLDLEAFEKDRSGEEPVEEEPEEDKTAPEKEHQKKQEVSAVEREKLSHVEKEIGRLDATVKMYTAQMSMDPDNYADLAAEYDEAQKKLEALYEKWDELAAKMD